MRAIYLKELRSSINGVLAWLFAAFLLLFAGIYTMVYNITRGYADFSYVLSAITFIYMVGVPILTMRTLAEERHSRTDQLLYALPIKLSHVVMGKFLALCSVLALPVLIMAVYPPILSMFGNVNLKLAYTALAGFFMLGCALLSVGLFISSLTESQVASAVLTLAAMLVMYFISSLASFVPTTAGASLLALCIVILVFCVIVFLLTRNAMFSVILAVLGEAGLYVAYMINKDMFSGLFANIMSQLSLFDRYDAFTGGVFDLTGLVYFITVTVVFLFMTVQSLEKRRWS